MTLQERILEVLGENKALRPPALYRAFSGDSAAAVDAAVSALMRAGRVTYELGLYQRGKVRDTPPRLAGAPAPVDSAPLVQLRPVKPNGKIAARRAIDPLTRRQREIIDLVDAGMSRPQIAGRLGISEGAVKSQLHNARARLRVSVTQGRSTQPQGPLQPAPSAAAQLSAAPSKEGAEPATVGAAPSRVVQLVAGPKEERRRAPTFSDAMRERLVARQKAKAEELQKLFNQVRETQQELADLEEMVRMATAKEGAA